MTKNKYSRYFITKEEQIKNCAKRYLFLPSQIPKNKEK